VSERFEFGAAGHRLHEPATVEQVEAVADQVGGMRVVGDQDDADTSLAGLPGIAQDDAGLLDTQGAGGLVEDEDLRTEVDGAGDGDGLSFTAAELATICPRSACWTPCSGPASGSRTICPSSVTTTHASPACRALTSPRSDRT
jgi:hypothetical protein